MVEFQFAIYTTLSFASLFAAVYLAFARKRFRDPKLTFLVIATCASASVYLACSSSIGLFDLKQLDEIVVVHKLSTSFFLVFCALAPWVMTRVANIRATALLAITTISASGLIVINVLSDFSLKYTTISQVLHSTFRVPVFTYEYSAWNITLASVVFVSLVSSLFAGVHLSRFAMLRNSALLITASTVLFASFLFDIAFSANSPPFNKTEFIGVVMMCGAIFILRLNTANAEISGVDMPKLANGSSDTPSLGSGESSAESFTFDLGAMIRQAVTNASKMALMLEKNIEIKTQRQPKVPDSWVSDRSVIEQILDTVTRNAIRATNAGSITIGSALTREGNLQIYVEDSGAGFENDELAKPFEPIEVDSIVRDSLGKSSDLSLSVASDLARIVGGRLTARSKGSNKACRIELLLPEQPAPDKAELIEDRPRQMERSALLITNDPDTQRLATRLLASKGYLTFIARSEAEGKRLAESLVIQPKLSLLDLDTVDSSKMPHIERSALFESDDAENARILAVGGKSSQILTNPELIDHGSFIELSKPLKALELFDAIERLFALKDELENHAPSESRPLRSQANLAKNWDS